MICSPNRGSEWGSDGLVRGSGLVTGTVAPPPAQLLLAGIANGDLCSRLVYAKRSPPAVYISVFTMNSAHFLARACLGLPRPAVSQMAPRCLPDVSQMSPRCLPDVSQMAPRWLPDVSQMAPRWLPDVSHMSPGWLPDVSHMSPICLPDGSQMSPRCHPDVTQMSLTDYKICS